MRVQNQSKKKCVYCGKLHYSDQPKILLTFAFEESCTG